MPSLRGVTVVTTDVFCASDAENNKTVHYAR